MSKKLKEALKIIIFFGLGLFVTYMVYNTMETNEKNEFWESISGANYFWLLVSIFIGTLAHYVRALRWKLIIEPFGYKPRTYNLFFAVMNMYFFNALVPRLGEVTRCAILRNYEKIPVEKSLGTVVAERAVDMLCFAGFLGLIFIVSSEIYWQTYEAIQVELARIMGRSGTKTEPGFFMKNWKYIVFALVVTLFVFLFMFRKNKFVGKIYDKVLSLIKGFWQGLKSTLLIKKKWLFVFYTFSIWALYFLMMWACFFSLPGRGVTTDPAAPFVVMIFGTFAIMATPNGLGTFPAVVAVVLGLEAFGGLDRVTGNALGWIMWGTQEIMILAVGVIVMILIPVFNRNNKPLQDS